MRWVSHEEIFALSELFVNIFGATLQGNESVTHPSDVYFLFSLDNKGCTCSALQSISEFFSIYSVLDVLLEDSFLLLFLALILLLLDVLFSHLLLIHFTFCIWQLKSELLFLWFIFLKGFSSLLFLLFDWF
jgi:hypothetical protein